ncbi:MAG: HNH endonuclease [Acholeplasmataceae bacterium]|nr:HNH endonuclease [Acholeplasmataceae bacterium]
MTNTFLKDFVDILKNCSYDNTYKMAWAKALVQTSEESNHIEQDGLIVITLHDLARKIIGYYWNQTFFFDLDQGSNPKKPPRLKSLVEKMIKAYQETFTVIKPERYERVSWKIEKMPDFPSWIKEAVRILKFDVSHRFLNLGKKRLSHLYQYQKNDDVLLIKTENLDTLKKHAYMLYDIINYRWSLILETFNHSPRIGKKVRIIEDEKIRRSSLNKYIPYLMLDDPNPICFICGKPIKNNPEIDHVIPWSYMYSDDLWNLVYVHDSCNASKSNRIPDEQMIRKLESRNQHLVAAMKSHGYDNKEFQELILAQEENLVRKFWIGCQ